jgi:hypothetical protein
MDASRKQTIMIAMLTMAMSGAATFVVLEPASQAAEAGRAGDERVISEATTNLLPGDRLVLGRIKDIRGDQIEVDIANPQSLYIPLKPAKLKGQAFKPGDSIIVTLNDHNAVVDYHHPNERSDHHVIRGRLITPLTVGLDKAVIETEQGIETFMVVERAKGKLTAMPIGAEVLFMTDETGRLVDAQLASAQAVQESAGHNKARIKGAHQQVRAVFQSAEQLPESGPSGEGRLKIVQEGQEREVPYRPPLRKLDRLQAGQDVVLLMDDDGYVLEIATPDVLPNR